MPSSERQRGMQFEKPEQEPGEEFRNLNHVDEVILGDDPARQEALRQFLSRHGFDERKIESSFRARRLRREVLDAMKREKDLRLQADPAPTDDELLLGVYREDIEPQVRDAVVTLAKKGYPTRGSGFDHFDEQSIYLDSGRSDFLAVPEETRAKLAALNVRLDDKGRYLRFACEDADVGKIKAKWDAIAAILPDLGTPPVAHEPYNLTFAKNAKKYRGKSYPRYEKYYDAE